MTGLGKLGQEHRRLVDEGLIKTIGHAQRREKALDAYALACVDAALADEWKLLDGPEFDYKKLTAEQENLYAYAFNTGSKQAWEQAKVEHKAALSDTLGMLEEIAKKGDDVVWRGLQVRYIAETEKFIYFRPVDNLVNLVYLTRDEAQAALLVGKEKKG